jgi:hypothetical protein
MEALGEQARAALRQFARETDYFNAAEIEVLIRRGRSTQLWYLYNLALWWRRFIRNQPLAAD